MEDILHEAIEITHVCLSFWWAKRRKVTEVCKGWWARHGPREKGRKWI